jgi:glycosyltransferase involved in cell wall biosynthesis
MMSKTLDFMTEINSLIRSKSLDSRAELYFLKNYIVGDFDLFVSRQKFICKIEANIVKNSSFKVNSVDRPLVNKYLASLPWHEKNIHGMNSYIKDILGYDHYTYAERKNFNYDVVDDYYVWGEDKGVHDLSNYALAVKNKKRLIRLEYGFISSKDIALKESPQHSLILCPEVMYYDATKVSDMEKCLSGNVFELSEDEIERSRRNIEEIIKHGITKYNHAPKISLNERLGLSKKNKRILLVDQRFGDKSIEMGLASQNSFKEMYDVALTYKDHDVFVKLHPDALTGGKESALSKVLPARLPSNVYLIDFDINPYSLLESMDKVFVCVSQFGFEALLAKKEVHTFGVAFYSHWGVTIDHVTFNRRRNIRTLEEIFYVFYILYSAYYIPNIGRCSLEDIIKYFSDGSEEDTKIQETTVYAPITKKEKVIKLLFILPSGRFGASGRYMQELAWHMQKHNAEVMVLAEGNEIQKHSGITWLNLDFDGVRLSKKIVDKVLDFNPDFVYENGVRSRAQRAALELMFLTGAKLAMQSEDDDVQVYNERHPSPSSECIAALDKPIINKTDILNFISKNDWNYTLNVLADPNFDRWVEPLLRSLCYQLSVFNTAIWYPYEERLKKEFNKPTFVLPPVTSEAAYSKLNFTSRDKSSILKKYGFGEDGFIFFLGGTIYDYSKEYFLFLEALNILCNMTDNQIYLVTVSGRSNIDVKKVTEGILNPSIKYVDLGAPNDEDYMNMLLACDIVCSPGIPDRFNLYRLPSRLVKAMFLSKAVLTSKCGFGSSLKHGFDGIIIDGKNPKDWADAIFSCLNQSILKGLGEQALCFARVHFEVRDVAKKLVNKFREILG